MDDSGKNLVVLLLQTIESLCFRNLALETILRSYEVPAWETFAAGLASDKRVHTELRGRFREIYEQLEHEPQAKDDTQTRLEQFLQSVKVSGKPN